MEPHAFYFAAPSDNATCYLVAWLVGLWPAIDNVTVTQVSAVPEPAMIFLLAFLLPVWSLAQAGGSEGKAKVKG